MCKIHYSSSQKIFTLIENMQLRFLPDRQAAKPLTDICKNHG